jgi:hypothetical protein
MLSNEERVLGEQVAEELGKLAPTNPPMLAFDGHTTDFELLLTVLGLISACAGAAAFGWYKVKKAYKRSAARQVRVAYARGQRGDDRIEMHGL